MTSGGFYNSLQKMEFNGDVMRIHAVLQSCWRVTPPVISRIQINIILALLKATEKFNMQPTQNVSYKDEEAHCVI